MGIRALARRATVVCMVVVACALVPSAASAATLPAGDYTAEITGGTVDIGSLAAVALPSSPPVQFTVPPGTPTSVSLSGLLLDPAFNLGHDTTATFTAFSASVDPSTGAMSGSASGYLTVTSSTTPTGTCNIGSDTNQITLSPSTANPGGSPWDPATGAVTLVDNTFAVPAASCTNPLLEAAVDFLLGNTASGNNGIVINGLIKPVAPPNTGGGGDTGSGSGSGSGSGTGTGDQGSNQTGTGDQGSNQTGTTTQDPNSVAACVVPKLKGKKLKRAKRMLTTAGCTVKVKRKRSRKKPGTVLKQKPKAGTVLAPFARVTIIVAKR